MLKWALDFPEAADNLFVVHAEDKAIPSPLSGMGRKGNKMIATKSKIVKGCKVTWHIFQPNETEMVLQAYKGFLYFALMSEAEFEGTIFEECPLVMQLYPKTSQNDAVANLFVAPNSFLPMPIRSGLSGLHFAAHWPVQATLRP